MNQFAILLHFSPFFVCGNFITGAC